MKAWKIALLMLGAAIVSAAITSAKQEHDSSYPQTRRWPLLELGHEDSYQSARVDVIDTAGVCLYVVRGFTSSGGNAITAVPKTQLPKGSGCQ